MYITSIPQRYCRLSSSGKASIMIKLVMQIVWFPNAYIKVMFTLYCSLLDVQQHFA